MSAEIIVDKMLPHQAEPSGKIELEHETKNPILLLGGGHGTGAELAKLLVASGRDVHLGTRSLDNFDRLKSELADADGKVLPFIADITNPEQVQEALRLTDIADGQPVDYFALAAEGFRPVQVTIYRAFNALKRQMEKPEGLTREFAQAETQKMKEFMLRLESREEAWRTNAIAPIEIANLLIDHGNLDSSSKIAVLDSTISKYAQEVIPYPGPWFYFPVGISKAEGALILREMARNIGATFIDFIAPGITETKAGDFFELFRPVLQALHELEAKDTFEFPTPPASEIARMMFNELSRERSEVGAREIDLYLGYKPGEASYDRPPGFRVPTVDWL